MLRELFEKARNYYYRVIAREISGVARYYDELIHFKPLAHDSQELFDLIDCPKKSRATEGSISPNTDLYYRSIYLLNGNLNYDQDIVGTLSELSKFMTRFSRLVVVAYNPYLRWLYQSISLLKLRSAPIPTTFLTYVDLENLARLSGFEIIRSRETLLLPFSVFGIGDFINRVFTKLPILRGFSLATIIVLRACKTSTVTPSVSIAIPARNERGNIRALLESIPQLGPQKTEILFVEGHSTDGTWEEIERVTPEFQDKFSIRNFKQSGHGKNDAVRLAFAESTNDLLIILDADISVAPEDLSRFYLAWCQNHGDFINGNRLTYPMQQEAMRFLNRLGNIFFAKALSSVLECRLGDTLCGTKVVLKSDYHRMRRWRIDFGDFDPFGDFELLFPAAVLCLGIIDVPISYRQRVYGQTNIQRFRHGLMLLKMTAIGLVRVRFG